MAERADARRVRLARASRRRQREFLAAVRRSRRLHARWVAPPASAPAYRTYLARLRRPTHLGYFEIVRGNFQSAYLGYYAFTPHAGQGLIREGLASVIDDAFTRLKLHRLEANIQPANQASIRLVRTLGFQREGVSRRYLQIFARWRNHERWALLAEDWQKPRRQKS